MINAAGIMQFRVTFKPITALLIFVGAIHNTFNRCLQANGARNVGALSSSTSPGYRIDVDSVQEIDAHLLWVHVSRSCSCA